MTKYKYVKVKWGKDRSIFESDSVVGNMHHIIHYNISKYFYYLYLLHTVFHFPVLVK